MSNLSIVNPLAYSGSERAEMEEKIARANAEAKANWSDDRWRKAMAQEMTETLFFGFEHENLISRLFEVENVGFEARVVMKETRGLRAFQTARGGYIEESTLHTEEAELERVSIGFHVSESEDKLMTDFADTQATLVSRGIQKMDAEVNSWALSLVRTATPSSGTNSNYTTGAGVSLASLNTAIRKVQDATDTGKVSIVGRAFMTSRILDAVATENLFAPNTNEGIISRNVLGSYRGVDIVTLRHWKDDLGASFFPGNELLVVASDSAKFAFYGGLMSKEFTEDDNWYWHYLARRDFGGLVHHVDRVHRVVDSTATA